MITDKIVRGAGSHRILLALLDRARSSRDLKRVVGAVNGVSRFRGDYMDRLVANGFVFEADAMWFITELGRQKCAQVGTERRPDVAGPRTAVFVAAKIERPPVRRPGAEDFLNWPSRRGNTLYFRDGRKVRIET